MFSLIRFIRSIDVKYFESLFIQIKGIGRNSACIVIFCILDFTFFPNFTNFPLKELLVQQFDMWVLSSRRIFRTTLFAIVFLLWLLSGFLVVKLYQFYLF